MNLENHLSRVATPRSPVGVIEADGKNGQSLNIVLQEPMDAQAFIAATSMAEIICRYTGRGVYICTTPPRADWGAPYLTMRTQLMVRGRLIPGLEEWATKVVVVVGSQNACAAYWGGGRDFVLDHRFKFDELADWVLNYVRRQCPRLAANATPPKPILAADPEIPF